MGSRMAAHLIAAGHTVRIWNRSPEKAAPQTSKARSRAERSSLRWARRLWLTQRYSM